jgi:hypothetical protein
MKNFKTLGLFLLFAASVFTASAQVKQLTYNAFQTDVEHVIMDYPNSFQHFIGDELVKNPQSTDYSSLLKIRGSEDCRITKYPSEKKNFYSFQSVLLTTEEFETAKDKFSSYYQQLSNLSVRFSNRTLNLKGEYEVPDDSKKFTSIVFTTNGEGDFSKRLKVELLLEYVLMEWKVKLLVYEKEREEDEAPVVSSK